MRERFDELLPWYVNGTLGAADRVWLERYVDAHPDAAAELADCTRMAQAIVDSQVAVAEDVGLARSLARIAPIAGTPRAQAPRRRWMDLFGERWLRPALACSLAIIVVQSVVLVRTGEQAPLRYREATPLARPAEPADAAVYLRVMFKPTITEAELRLLLVGSEAWLAGGPGASGEYFLALDPDHAAAAREKLQASELVVSAEVGVAPRRPR